MGKVQVYGMEHWNIQTASTLQGKAERFVAIALGSHRIGSLVAYANHTAKLTFSDRGARKNRIWQHAGIPRVLQDFQDTCSRRAAVAEQCLQCVKVQTGSAC